MVNGEFSNLFHKSGDKWLKKNFFTDCSEAVLSRFILFASVYCYIFWIAIWSFCGKVTVLLPLD